MDNQFRLYWAEEEWCYAMRDVLLELNLSFSAMFKMMQVEGLCFLPKELNQENRPIDRQECYIRTQDYSAIRVLTEKIRYNCFQYEQESKDNASPSYVRNSIKHEGVVLYRLEDIAELLEVSCRAISSLTMLTNKDFISNTGNLTETGKPQVYVSEKKFISIKNIIGNRFSGKEKITKN